MTLQELRGKVAVNRGKGYNTYNVQIKWRGKYYGTFSNNSQAWDRLTESNYIHPSSISDGYTEKQALLSFYDECKRNNHLGEYNY